MTDHSPAGGADVRPNLTRLSRRLAKLIHRATEGDDTKTAIELRAEAETMAQSFAEAERQEREQAQLLRRSTPALYPAEPGRR